VIALSDACDSIGCKFKFEVLKSGFVVVFYRSAEDDDNLGGATQDTTQVITQDKVIEFCAEPRSKAEIAEHCGFRSIKHLSDKYMKPLLNADLLAMTIPDKPNSRNQKYIAVKQGMKEP